MESNLKLSEEQLTALEEMGADFFSPTECAIALQISVERFSAALKDKSNDAHKRYYKGRMTEVARHRRNVKELANMGSSPAQQQVEKFIEKSSFGD